MKTFPVDVLPSHVHLSALDQVELFGSGQAMTVARNHTQPGQVVYDETVAVFGSTDAFVRLRILGPSWKTTSVELTPTEAELLGIPVVLAKEGDVSTAASVRIVGPAGEITLDYGAIVPEASLLLSTIEAKHMHVRNGDRVTVRVVDVKDPIENVLVRVHPQFQLRLQIHADMARKMWITGAANAQLIQ